MRYSDFEILIGQSSVRKISYMEFLQVWVHIRPVLSVNEDMGHNKIPYWRCLHDIYLIVEILLKSDVLKDIRYKRCVEDRVIFYIFNKEVA